MRIALELYRTSRDRSSARDHKVKLKNVISPVSDFLARYDENVSNLKYLEVLIAEDQKQLSQWEQELEDVRLRSVSKFSVISKQFNRLKSQPHVTFLLSALSQMRCLHQGSILSILSKQSLLRSSTSSLDFDSCKATSFGSQWCESKEIIKNDPFSLFWLHFFFTFSPGRQLPVCPALLVSSFSRDPAQEIYEFVKCHSQSKWAVFVVSLGEESNTTVSIAVLQIEDTNVTGSAFYKTAEEAAWFRKLEDEAQRLNFVIRFNNLHLPDVSDRS